MHLRAALGKGKHLVNGSYYYNQTLIFKAALVPGFYQLVWPISKPHFLVFLVCVLSHWLSLVFLQSANFQWKPTL